MTGKEVLRQAMELMLVPSDSLTDYTAFALPIINGLLPELYSINEMICLAQNQQEEQIPMLKFASDLQEDIPLRQEVAALLPLGVCVHLTAEDDDNRRSWFENLYRQRKAVVSRTCPVAVKDVY